MTAPAGAAYEVRELRPDDESSVLALLTASLAGGPTGRRSADFLRWKHQANPFGASPGLVAIAPDGTIAAVRFLLRWQLRTRDGSVLRAVRAVDTATAPEHQGKGLFRRLTLSALDTVAADADLVFNTPNSASRPGYLKMGWRTVGDLPISLRPVRPLRFLRGVRGTGQAPVEEVPAPVPSSLVRAGALFDARPDEVTALLGAAQAGQPAARLHTPKDLQYLAWRYGAVPGLDYRAVVLDDCSGLRGLGLGRLRHRGALTEFTLAEVFTAPGDLRAVRGVLRLATRAGTDHVAAHLTPGTPLVLAGRSAGYLPVPGRGLSLVVNPRTPMPVPVDRLSSWALALGDLEVF